MPTYVYACDSCSAQFEQFQRFSDEPLATCPRCQGGVRRVFQPVGIVFKGSGWYVTDSRNKNTASTGSTTTSDADASSSSTESSDSSNSTSAASSDSSTTSTSTAKSDSPATSSSS